MRLTLPHRVSMARTPTPLEPLSRTSEVLGIELWVKRDDLTGIALSGNKVRKLEFLVAEALAQKADTLITCGGVNSNHARATAVAAAQQGLASHLVLRGQDRHPPAGNLLIDRVLGAEITFITQEEWRERDRKMSEIAESLRSRGRRPYVIPEGGSNALGSLGYALAAKEILDQCADQGVAVKRLVHATGSGGTTAGLALGLAALDRNDIDVFGVAVCDDREYFDQRITSILDAAEASGFVDAAVRARARWTILEGYKGRGYALTTEEEMRGHVAMARREGIFVDPVYTGKAFRAVSHEARSGRFEDGVTVFVHTGGLFELFAYAEEIDALSTAVPKESPPA